MSEQLERRRREAAAAWDGPVLVAAGEPIHVPGRADLTYRFRAHSEYLYLTGRERPGGVLAFDPDEGWTDFVRPVTRDEQLWEGADPAEVEGVPVAGLRDWLERRAGRATACLGAPLSGVASDAGLEAAARAALNAIRRRKDEAELGLIREAVAATAAGFAALRPLIRPGATERELQIELEAAFFRAGADGLAFDTIVAGGPNSAVLHFPPTGRPLGAGELLLVDAGAEVRAYAGDVTRTYPVSGGFTPEQAELHAIVVAAGAAATARCAAGVEWRDVHRAAALVVAEGLAGFGLLRGDPETLVERGAVTLFFPHGVGHLLGLGVRDAGEVPPGREPPAGFPALRVDLPLEPGWVVTVEPGVYLVPALVDDAETRARLRGEVDWDAVDRLRGFGGIRVENDVLVTAGEPEVLTAVPVFG